MPKASWNIKDFSGGFNSFIDKRDIEDNQSSIINNLIAPNKGVLKLAGGFIIPGQFDGNEGGFGESGINLNTAFYLQPSSHFIKYYRGIASNAGSSTTVTITSRGHGLTTNTLITIVKGLGTHATDLDINGNQYRVTKTAWNTFTIVVDTAIDLSTDSETWYFCVGGNFIGSDTFSPDSIKAYDNPLSNQLVLKANNKNQFGFYNVNEGFFVGSNRSDSSLLQTNAWLFDTQYLWNVNQYNSDHPNLLSNAPSDYHTSHILEDGYYIDGVFRAIETRPKYWQFGNLRRPVGYYYIEKHKKFNAMDYYSGWYPLRAHCLSPAQYQQAGGFSEEDFYGIAGVLTTSTGDGTIPTHAGNITDSNRAYQVNIEVDMGTEEGDWNFASGAEHQKLGLGISYIYDDINWQNDINFSQESNITKLTSDGTSTGNNTVTIGSGENLKALSLIWKVHKGKTLDSPINNELFSGIDGAIADNRSSEDNGHSNIEAWNPRIVGAKVYLMETANEVLKDPTYLATINFYGEESKHGLSQDFEKQSSTSWTNESGTDLYYQGILNIIGVPVLEYSEWNGYNHYEQINAWYKTSAIVNRKLYAGNVSYFDETNPLNITSADKQITSSPDKILVSPENNFDVLPIKNHMELSKNDGQDIVKLQAFNKDLLIYKTNDLFILDCSSPDGKDVLKFTFYGNGVSLKHHISSSPLGIFSINKLGLFVYNGETNTNLLTGKIDADYWSNKIFSEKSNVLYDPQYNLVFITSDYNLSHDNNIDENSNVLIYNLTTQAFFYKSQLSNSYVGFLSNGLNIDGRLYSTTGLPSPSDEQFIADNSIPYVPSVSALYRIEFSTTGTGTYPGPSGGTCPAGLLSTDVMYMKVQRNSDGKWILLNKVPLVYGDFGSEAANIQNISNRINETGNSGNHMDDEYYWNSSKINDTTASVTIYSISTNGTYSSDQNFLAEDITSINAAYGTSAFAFASNETESTNTSTAGLSYGNLDSFSIKSSRNASPRVNGVWQIQFNRNGNRGVETIYTLELKTKSSNSEYITRTYRYDLGVDYFADTDYVSTPPTSGIENTDDDNLTTSFRKALELGVIKSEEGTQPITTYMDIGDIASSGAGTAQFSLTDTSGSFYQDIQINTYIENTREDFSGHLLQWYNVLPKDASGNSLMNVSEINLETKDIDFNEPGIRKKVYKAYITYTQGDGNIKCYYQANQSGTWTAADVKDASGSAATTANQLNNSSTQTRAELSFGTGGNNIYSFALKFESIGIVTEFEINDLSLIYRLKRAK